MNKMSKQTVFSDSSCLYCNETISYASLYKYFYSHDLRLDFEYMCPSCLNIINITVESVPVFKFEKSKVNHP